MISKSKQQLLKTTDRPDERKPSTSGIPDRKSLQKQYWWDLQAHDVIRSSRFSIKHSDIAPLTDPNATDMSNVSFRRPLLRPNNRCRIHRPPWSSRCGDTIITERDLENTYKSDSNALIAISKGIRHSKDDQHVPIVFKLTLRDNKATFEPSKCWLYWWSLVSSQGCTLKSPHHS